MPTTEPNGSTKLVIGGPIPVPDRWPQGQHPYLHHDPDWWLGWELFEARWLLCWTPLSIDLWGFEEPALLSELLPRVQAIRPLLDDNQILGLERALDDIYCARFPSRRNLRRM